MKEPLQILLETHAHTIDAEVNDWESQHQRLLCIILFDLTFLLAIFKVVFYFRYKTTVEQINQRISSLVEAGCSANEMSEVKSSVLGLKVNLLKSIRRWNGTFGKILAQQVWSLKLNSILLASYLPSRIIVKIYVFTDTSSRFVSVVFDSVLEPLHLKGYVLKFHKGAESAQKPFKGPRTRREICYR